MHTVIYGQKFQLGIESAANKGEDLSKYSKLLGTKGSLPLADIINIVKSETKPFKHPPVKVTKADFKDIEDVVSGTIPEDYYQFMVEVGYLGSENVLTGPKQIAKDLKDLVKSKNWNSAWLPIQQNGFGDYLVIDTSTQNGKVLFINHAKQWATTPHADSFLSYLNSKEFREYFADWVKVNTKTVSLESIAQDIKAMELKFYCSDVGLEAFSYKDLWESISEKIKSAVASFADACDRWNSVLSKWDAPKWSQLDEKAQLKGIKKANLQFFYYNPNYLPTFESLYSKIVDVVNTVTSSAEVKDNTANTIAMQMLPDLRKLTKALGVDVERTNDVNELKIQFKALVSGLKDYEPKEGAVGDAGVVPKLVEFLDSKMKVLRRALPKLEALVKNGVGSESNTNNRGMGAVVFVLISLAMWFVGLFPLWIILMLAYSIGNIIDSAIP